MSFQAVPTEAAVLQEVKNLMLYCCLLDAPIAKQALQKFGEEIADLVADRVVQKIKKMESFREWF